MLAEVSAHQTRWRYPRIAPTRTDLEVFIYQSLLYLREVQKIPCDYRVVLPKPELLPIAIAKA
ncbi:hypothetical protein [Mastigocladopsis repens]|uniref:hypothetical protein n=1 Tax=Mastigocladopsis repens TaxID=221287 RepID=UPI0003103728|nr:hypothetical protein [Mastigocladopsis repens]